MESTITGNIFSERPARTRKVQREAKLQSVCVRWYRLAHRNGPLLFHIPNGGKRNAREAAYFKAEGVVSGVPDLFLAAGRHGFNGMFIEMKVGRNGESANQKEVRGMLENSGYYCTVCRSLDEFMNTVEHYLKPL